MTERKIRLAITAAAVVGAVIVALAFIFHGVMTYLRVKPDAPPPEDADVRLAYLEIPDKENAFYYFDKAIGELYEMSKEEREQFSRVLHGETWDEAFVKAFLDKNGKWHDYVEEGLRCERFQVPEIADYGALLPYLASWRQIARLSSLRALYLLKTGKEKDALDECMLTIEFGHRIKDCRGGLIVYLVGVATQEIALRRFRDLLAQTELGAEALEPYIEKLAEYGANENGLGNAYRLEYVMFCNTIEDLATGKGIVERSRKDNSEPFRPAPRTIYFKPNKTKRRFATICRTLVANLPKHYAEMQLPEIEKYDRLGKIRLILKGNPVGDILIGMLAPALDRALVQKCRENCSVAATRILIALNCYKLKHGELPDTLEELVPEYFDVVPLDDFDGQLMRYSREKRIVYSIDADLEDNGGTSRDERADPEAGYDWVYKIGF